MSFCHLHLHGEFSLLDGCGKAENYAERAKEIKQDAFALTDHENLAGALYHAQACDDADIKPIIGIETYFEPYQGWAKETQTRGHHLLLLAKNAQGFQNLMRLSSVSFEHDRFYRNPLIDWELLSKFREGLICTSGCVNGYIPRLILQPWEQRIDGDPEEILGRFLGLFGDDFYMEIQPHDFDGQNIANDAIISMAQERGVPLLATCDAHYPDEDWRLSQGAVRAMRSSMGTKSEKEEDKDKTAIDYAYPTQWMMSEEEVRKHFASMGVAEKYVDEGIATSLDIAKSVDAFTFSDAPKFPRVEVDAKKTITEWCREGLTRIGKEGVQEYEERLAHELAMFDRKDAFDYFYIIGDMVRWAKLQGIRVGPCRGSAGASLVLYLIRVTAIDPIGYDLLFERFMNDARAEMPDVDIDFQADRRDEVRQYLVDKYGEEQVADVAAFQSFGMKSVIKDLGRVFRFEYMEGESVSKELDDEAIGTTLEDVVDKPGHERVAKWREDHPDAWDTATRLEGQIKNMSKHAAAVVVTDGPVRELMPTMRIPGLKSMRGDSDETKGQEAVTQWSARANNELIATYGFLKIDMLVTEALTIQQKCIEFIKERHGVVVDFEDPITHPEIVTPVGEREVCERFGKGSNLGIFQFAGPAAMRAAAEIKPTEIEHLIAANAMARPGPMAYIGKFSKRKNGKEEYEIPEQAESVLGRTYGVITYQEQVMMLFIVLAGVDPGIADKARKVVGKGVARDIEGRKKLEEFRKIWMDGCKKSGVATEYAKQLFADILEMSTYSFNRAHAAGYALQAYQDQWLKTHYPVEYYAAIMTVKPKEADSAIREARAYKIEVMPPDVNSSGIGFTLDGDSIRFGLLGIQNVGDTAASKIMELRPFANLEEFDEKIAAAKAKRMINSRVRQSLIDCGAFDFDGQRDGMHDEVKGEYERNLLGFSPSQKSQLAEYREFLDEFCLLDILDEAEDGQRVNVAGEVVEVKRKKTKKGDPYAFVRLWFDGQDIETVFWSEQLSRYKDLLTEGNAILLRGKWQEDRRSLTVTRADSVSRLAAQLAEEDN